MSQESGIKAAQPIPALKILPAQLTKLIKEEDDETWISGEELYTEGSSDEENCSSKAAEQAGRDSPRSSKQIQRPAMVKPNKRAQAVPSPLATSAASGHSSPARPSDEEDEYVADDEISWKANKDESIFDDEIAVLEEHQLECKRACEKVDVIFENFMSKLQCTDKLSPDCKLNYNEIFKSEIKRNIDYLDSTIDKVQSKIELMKQETEEIQKRNRLRLKEIITKSPPESKKLAENTKGFFELTALELDKKRDATAKSKEKTAAKTVSQIEFKLKRPLKASCSKSTENMINRT